MNEERRKEVDELRAAVVAAELSPVEEGRRLLADCRNGDGTLDERCLLKVLTRVVVQRNKALGLAVEFKDIFGR
jgi:DNA-directed RNA polymerase alpha subunit